MTRMETAPSIPARIHAATWVWTGKGPFDLAYPGPDTGEGDGIPQNGEPNFDELDVDESDQIGLTGYDLDTRPFYESGDNLRDDTWLWDQIFNVAEPNIIIGATGLTEEVADVEPFILFTSGPVSLQAACDNVLLDCLDFWSRRNGLLQESADGPEHLRRGLSVRAATVHADADWRSPVTSASS